MNVAHIAMMYGRHVTVVPSNCDRVPTRFGDMAAVAGIASPINAAALLEGLGFGGIHVHLALLQVSDGDLADRSRSAFRESGARVGNEHGSCRDNAVDD
jgi:hypothetical protein